jgi:hypothetical protein
VVSGWGDRWRRVFLEVGREYVIGNVSPHNSNRGRHCLLEGFVIGWWDKEKKDLRAKVRYLDNGRVGWPDPGALVEIEEWEACRQGQEGV